MSGVATVVRAVALGFGFLCLFGAGFALLSGEPVAALWGAVSGVMLIAGVAFERWRYKATVVAAGENFQPTAERFVDTNTGRPVQVFVDPRNGERRYVES